MAARVSSNARWWAIALTALLAVAAALAAAGGIAAATDRSEFCTSCHEMQPFHDAWAKGPHANVSCVDCHVDAGTVARLQHKFVALREVRAHILGEPSFPLADAPDVPDERCVGCHENVTSTRPGFSHADHAAEGPCQTCHANAGHDVTSVALGKAGILNETALRARASARTAVVGKGVANLGGHVTTDCETCHDMKATACKSCHTAKHAARKQDCSTCHQPGPAFVFAHPASPACIDCHARPAEHTGDTCTQCHDKPGLTWAFDHKVVSGTADCAGCHTRPADHDAGSCSTCHQSGMTWAFTHPASDSCARCHTAPAGHYGTDCSSCHTATVPFDRTTLEHPTARATCTTCHRRPASHRSGACSTCHPRVGVSWAFTHPAAKSCTSCHRAPTGHSTAACATCHRVGAAWTFSHPGASATCTTCHARPAGHASGTCSACHSVGATWAFKHPASTACASCHQAPASHYGASCASCHSAGARWSDATFRHPAIRGGEHTYRSFACTNCHPGGYSSATCAQCHDSPTGPDDDDD